MLHWIAQAFSLVCGQNPEHTWAPGGLALPCCQRCTGLYVGAALGFLLSWWFKPPSTSAWRWVHGLLLLLMLPFGFHWVPQGPVLRTLTGFGFGTGLVAYLRLPLETLCPKTAGRPTPRRGYCGYGLGLALAAVLMPCAAAWGGLIGAAGLLTLVVAGAGTLWGLALINLGLSIAAIFKRLARPLSRVPS